MRVTLIRAWSICASIMFTAALDVAMPEVEADEVACAAVRLLCAVAKAASACSSLIFKSRLSITIKVSPFLMG